MTCPDCHNPLPDLALVCPACLLKRNESAVYEQQLVFLVSVVKGRYSLKTAVIGRVRHIWMFGERVTRTWCGDDITRAHKRGVLAWDELEKHDVCTKCRIEVRRAAQEAVAA